MIPPALPCDQCDAPCCSCTVEGDATRVAISASEFIEFAPDCPHLRRNVSGRRSACDLKMRGERVPDGCLRFDCSRDAGFQSRHPEVLALLTIHGA